VRWGAKHHPGSQEQPLEEGDMVFGKRVLIISRLFPKGSADQHSKGWFRL